ncbi:MAG: single-stranded DNA-binding protein [bacterium]|nr:single-stranded DNA-binding protein [bacterium]
MYLNKVIIVGNIVRDPELKALPAGIKVCTMSIATNRYWKDKDGAKQEAVDYHNIVIFGRQAETTAQYMKKGSNVMVEGRLQTRSWDDKTSGEKKYRTEIIADRVQFGSSSRGPASGAKSDVPSGDSAKDMPVAGAIEYPEEEINPDDIPF